MSNNPDHNQSGDSASVYKVPHNIARDERDNEPIQSQPQRQYQTQTPPQQPQRQYSTSYPAQHPSQSQYPNQYPQQYQGNYPQQYQQQQQQYQQQYLQQQYQQYQQHQQQHPQQYQGNYPVQYQQQYPQGQYPPQQYPPGVYPGQRYPQHPPQPMNYGQPPRERGVFSNLFDGIFASSLGVLMISPFIQARKMLSIRPDTHPGEKLQRYMYGLPQLLRQQGITALWRDLGPLMAKIPAQTLDLTFFFLLKKIVHSPSRIMPWDVSWISNVFVAGSAATMRYLVYQPVQDAFQRISAYQSGMQGYANEIKNNLKNSYRNRGFKGLYSNLGVNIPMLFLFRGIQLGSIETSMQEVKQLEGHIGLFRKFLMCFSYTIIARFLMYPLIVARESGGIDEGSSKENMKRLLQKAKGVMKGAGMETFRIATSRSFRASVSAMSFAIFYHLRDEAPRY